ncbi:MAG: hypothetical protein ACXV74_00340 [Methylobacter sp.]
MDDVSRPIYSASALYKHHRRQRLRKNPAKYRHAIKETLQLSNGAVCTRVHGVFLGIIWVYRQNTKNATRLTKHWSNRIFNAGIIL